MSAISKSFINDEKREKISRIMNTDTVAGYIFALPFILGFLGFMLIPMFMSLYYSFTNLTLGRIGYEWIGFANYERMWNDPRFWNSLGVTFRFVFLSVPVRMVFGLLIAYVLTRKFRGVHGYRATYYLPTLIGGSIAVALVWGQMFQRGGVIYNIIEMFGFEGIHWFGSPTLAMIPLIFMNVWQFGAAMIIFAAGIKDIPETYIEAAAIDGANKLQIFFKIILPCLTPIILYNLVMQTIAAFMTFTQAFIITGGGPAEGTNFIALYIYNHAFTWRNMGYASAMSWILLLIVAVVTGVILKTSRRWTFYVNE
ncbi:MAG: sugar ABC transporter permease [Oscillospiraceae bacterium]|nr:sugar ABC transporter permease [Oscillospiraceae bacterium]MCL2279108.1 sugar ABC transporter permease [Oscillospiraceae bacterium]